MKPVSSINVIPFIDIMLVLLAIVLTTATFIAQGKIDVDLPPAVSNQSVPDEEPVELVIDRDEQVYFQQQQVNLSQLRQRLQSLPQTTPITLRVDARVQFARFVAIVDLLKALDLQRLTILTKAPA
jgi:biopolymer transport protein ExbD